jgi:hypothetical protein
MDIWHGGAKSGSSVGRPAVAAIPPQGYRVESKRRLSGGLAAERQGRPGCPSRPSPERGRSPEKRLVAMSHGEMVDTSNDSSPSIATAESRPVVLISDVARSTDIATSMERPPSWTGMHGPSGPADQWPPIQVYPMEGSDQPSQNGVSLSGSHGHPSAGPLQSREHPHSEEIPRTAAKRPVTFAMLNPRPQTKGVSQAGPHSSLPETSRRAGLRSRHLASTTSPQIVVRLQAQRCRRVPVWCRFRSGTASTSQTRAFVVKLRPSAGRQVLNRLSFARRWS